MAAPRKAEVNAVREFNRFYTRRIGVLRRGYLDSEFSLTEVRILYEVANGNGPAASEIGGRLELDKGYLSRTLKRFEKRGLLVRKSHAADGRSSRLFLTTAGRKAFAPLDKRSASMASAMLQKLPEPDKARVIDSMHAIESLISGAALPKPDRAITLRTHQPGDLGWIVFRHGALYAQEHGWSNGLFEALVAEIAAKFLKHFDATRERCWIAEVDGRPVGSVMVVNAGKRVAQLRLLLLEPEARGAGLGTRLVNECIQFARAAGYRKIKLWTQSHLDAAQHVYRKAGFSIIKEEQHNHYGYDLTGREWEMVF